MKKKKKRERERELICLTNRNPMVSLFDTKRFPGLCSWLNTSWPPVDRRLLFKKTAHRSLCAIFAGESLRRARICNEKTSYWVFGHRHYISGTNELYKDDFIFFVWLVGREIRMSKLRLRVKSTSIAENRWTSLPFFEEKKRFNLHRFAIIENCNKWGIWNVYHHYPRIKRIFFHEFSNFNVCP